MLADGKWISCTLRVVHAINSGAASVQSIAGEVSASPSGYVSTGYISGVLSVLRHHGILSKTGYQLTRPYHKIMAAEVIKLVDVQFIEDPLVNYISEAMLRALNIPIEQVLEISKELASRKRLQR